MIIDKFFKLGEKITKNDPKRTLDFNYYLLWIMFLAFFSILVGNVIDFVKFQRLQNLGWAVVMFAILWFQYQGLVQTYQARKMFKQGSKEKDQTKQEMLKEFEKTKK